MDIAVNQIVAITAATHRSHKLAPTNVNHPKNPLNPINQDGQQIPVYNIASGLSGPHNIQMRTLNDPTLKLEEPYIPEKNLMKVYKPFVIKKLDFSTQRAAKVMNLKCEHSQSLLDLETRRLEKLRLSNGHMNGLSIVSSEEAVKTQGSSQEWSDPPIDCGDLAVDVSRSIALGIHLEKGGDPQIAWHAYIAMIRDEMERRGPRAEWTSFVD